MRLFSSALIAVGAIGLLSACSPSLPKVGKSASSETTLPDYEVSKNGIVKEEDKHEYESLGDTTFVRTQSYKVRRVPKDGRDGARILFFKYVLKVGEKDISDGILSIVIDKGEGELLCVNRYDVKIANYDATPDPKCTYTPLGDLPLNSVNVTFK